MVKCLDCGRYRPRMGVCWISNKIFEDVVLHPINLEDMETRFGKTPAEGRKRILEFKQLLETKKANAIREGMVLQGKPFNVTCNFIIYPMECNADNQCPFFSVNGPIAEAFSNWFCGLFEKKKNK